MVLRAPRQARVVTANGTSLSCRARKERRRPRSSSTWASSGSKHVGCLGQVLAVPPCEAAGTHRAPWPDHQAGLKAPTATSCPTTTPGISPRGSRRAPRGPLDRIRKAPLLTSRATRSESFPRSSPIIRAATLHTRRSQSQNWSSLLFRFLSMAVDPALERLSGALGAQRWPVVRSRSKRLAGAAPSNASARARGSARRRSTASAQRWTSSRGTWRSPRMWRRSVRRSLRRT
mmetsp:Transcript_112632/g.318158  ORF Transcript_112632/g.318158 Transcript_112632/m.318158 type:complete len:232 (-) Transcript_112632:1334-2029(-)